MNSNTLNPVKAGGYIVALALTAPVVAIIGDMARYFFSQEYQSAYTLRISLMLILTFVLLAMIALQFIAALWAFKSVDAHALVFTIGLIVSGVLFFYPTPVIVVMNLFI